MADTSPFLPMAIGIPSLSLLKERERFSLREGMGEVKFGPLPLEGVQNQAVVFKAPLGVWGKQHLMVFQFLILNF
jgi:hypothetical protein